MPAILLIRHAQASYGASDYDVLSDLGHAQAAVLDAMLLDRRIRPTIAVTGPARRHRDTARLCERTLAETELAQDARWAEYDTDAILARHATQPVSLEGGDSSGLTSQEFQGVLDEALRRWLLDDDDSAAAHTWHRYLAQIDLALGELAGSLTRGETAVVFTSAGAIAAACCAVLGLSPSSFVDLNRVQVNAGVTKVVSGARGTSLVSFNEHGHLEEADRFLVTYR